MDTKVYKTSFNLSSEDYQVLEKLARDKRVTKADIVRQAISNYKFINDTVKSGGNVLVEDKNNQMSKVIFR